MGREAEAAALARTLATPGLAVLAGPPGIGKTALAEHAAQLAGRAVARAGALATLRHRPGLPLTRALRAPVPLDDVPLAVEAVRARLRGRVLLLDDGHWADGYTLAVLLALPPYCPVLVTLRTPSPLAAPALAALRRAATQWLDLPPLADAAAAAVARAAAPELAAGAVEAVVARAGGNPLAITLLARRPPAAALPATDPASYGVATMIAELPQDERTALAALGLLGRPAPAALLGPGAAALHADGLAVGIDGLLGPREPYVAEVAAGVLPEPARQAMHARLGALLADPGEAARHLAAAGDHRGAAARAQEAASAATSAGGRAELLLFALASAGQAAASQPAAAGRAGQAAAGQPAAAGRAGQLHAAGTATATGAATGTSPGTAAGSAPAGPAAGPALALAAAEAALAVGWYAEVRRILAAVPPGADPVGRLRRAVLLARALLASGDPAAAADLLHATAPDLPGAPEPVRGEHAVGLVLAALSDDPDVACALADYALAELGPAAPPALIAAHAQALRAAGRDGWADALRSALAAARGSGDLAGECAAGAALVAGLIDGCQLDAAGELAGELAQRCAAERAYSREVGFRAAGRWADLLRHGVTDDLVQEVTALTDRAAPADARGWLLATLGLAQADAGAIPAAWSALRQPGAPATRTLRWVQAETAWLDGGRAQARDLATTLAGGGDLAGELAAVTLAWCAADDGQPAPDDPDDADRAPVRATLAAWSTGEVAAFRLAAAGWAGAVVREQVRCLLAAGTLGGDLDALLDAERLAESAGLAALLGRARRALRARGVVRRSAPQAGGGLSTREREVLGLVGRGLSTRRIAELLGITRHTTETYVKSGMVKLGARTRTEAAVRAAGAATAARDPAEV